MVYDDYETECLEAFLILSAEARKIERRGWDSEQEYQRKVGHLDRILGLLVTYRRLRDELEALAGEVVESADEAEAITRARAMLDEHADVEVTGTFRVLWVPSVANPNPWVVKDLTPYLDAADLEPGEDDA